MIPLPRSEQSICQLLRPSVEGLGAKWSGLTDDVTRWVRDVIASVHSQEGHHSSEGDPGFLINQRKVAPGRKWFNLGLYCHFGVVGRARAAIWPGGLALLLVKCPCRYLSAL